MQGFIVSTLSKGMEGEFAKEMAGWVTEGKVGGITGCARPPRVDAWAALVLPDQPCRRAPQPAPCDADPGRRPWRTPTDTRHKHGGPPQPSAAGAADAIVRNSRPPLPTHATAQVRVIEHVTTGGVEAMGRAFGAMMAGGNLGKAVVKVADKDPFPVAKH